MDAVPGAVYREVVGIMPPKEKPSRFRIYRIGTGVDHEWLFWVMYYVENFQVWTPVTSSVTPVYNCSRRQKTEFDLGSDLYHIITHFDQTSPYRFVISTKDHDSIQEYNRNPKKLLTSWCGTESQTQNLEDDEKDVPI